MDDLNFNTAPKFSGIEDNGLRMLNEDAGNPKTQKIFLMFP